MNATQIQIDGLRERGYVVIPGFVPREPLRRLNETARTQLAARVPPLELEADLRYPGAPRTTSEPGGGTIRRLLDAYGRDPVFAEWARAPALRQWMQRYFGEAARLSRAHHNCVMTKHPRYGSLTGWHRDMRYWSFEREDLVSVWFALGEETPDNGGLWFVPGSHRTQFPADRFDAAKFFRADQPENASILQTATSPPLAPGDAVFFHCNTLHSAGQNRSDAVKYSLVFSYLGCGNSAKAGTRSASKPEVDL